MKRFVQVPIVLNHEHRRSSSIVRDFGEMPVSWHHLSAEVEISKSRGRWRRGVKETRTILHDVSGSLDSLGAVKNKY